jgi:hypothetical protein
MREMLIKLIRPILKDEYNVMVNFKKYYILKNRKLRKKIEGEGNFLEYLKVEDLKIFEIIIDDNLKKNRNRFFLLVSSFYDVTGRIEMVLKNEEIIYIRINKLDIVDEALDEFSLDINIRNDQERKLIRSLQKIELIEETFI